MKKFVELGRLFIIIFGLVFLLPSCERVAPNYFGVLMENYGKNGKADYSIQTGRVSTLSPGTELFQVPIWEQRAEFETENGEKRILNLLSADNSEFTAAPLYTYEVIQDSVISLVFKNSRLGSGEDFMQQLEYNVLEPRIYDIIKEFSKRYTTDELMATGGNLKFEKILQDSVATAFREIGIKLKALSPNLDFKQKVKDQIDKRNEVNTTISVLDQEIAAQKKRNELVKLQTEWNIEFSKGLTQQLLTLKFIEKWDGQTPLYGNIPIQILKGGLAEKQ